VKLLNLVPALLAALCLSCAGSNNLDGDDQNANEADGGRASGGRSPSERSARVDSVSVVDVEGFCEGTCARVLDCDNAVDLQTCTQSCRNANAASVPKLRGDVLQGMQSCLEAEDCRTVLDGAPIGTCLSEAVAAVAPSDAGKQFCDAWDQSVTRCGNSLNKATCLEIATLFNDDTLRAAAACTEKSCNQMNPCIDSTLVLPVESRPSDAGPEGIAPPSEGIAPPSGGIAPPSEGVAPPSGGIAHDAPQAEPDCCTADNLCSYDADGLCDCDGQFNWDSEDCR
jgi:hypothetical protein